MAKAVCVNVCWHENRLFQVGDIINLVDGETFDNPNFEVENSKPEKDKKSSVKSDD